MRSIDVVNGEITLLIGLDHLDEYGTFLNTVNKTFTCRRQKWTITLTRKLGRIFYTWGDSDTILFTQNEIVKLLEQYFHPRAGKIFKLLNSVDRTGVDQKTMDILKDISKACEVCQNYSTQYILLRARIPDSDIVFTQELEIDVMFLEEKVVLHVVYIATHFNETIFIPGRTVYHIWMAFIGCWVTLYYGFFNNLRTDQGSILTSN